MTVQWSAAVRNARNDAWQYGAITGQSGATNWAQSTGYTAFTSWIQSNGGIYVCTTTGTSASSGGGPSTTGSSISDGSCTWLYVGEESIGTSAIINIYTGAQPSSCASTETGTLLASFDLGSNYAGLSSGGVKSITGLPLSATASAAGTAGHYRILDSTATICHEQGSITVTGGGGDATIDTLSIAISQTVNLTGFTMTEPGA